MTHEVPEVNMEVTNIDEAELFFIRNSSGSVSCNKNGITKVVDCFTEAVLFFHNK
jgi:hypothetical protein